ncbi:hypothetical protein [Tautonia sociabilis]|uniref:Uncharacterized protein n=1 Tax=Tautonia sociabilis TaxID=2080755 RepID=A0A432MQP4_9BACT|nr:hypothetical protein [Tautonia sociabilis]RUL89365.1 hypothetical protein TsocGM_02855 [Tautonia sociabilis]
MCRVVRTLVVLAIVSVPIPGSPAQEPTRPSGSTPGDGEEPPDAREKMALEFVRQHHPELAGLLAPLKTMDRGAYDAAIRELSRTRENLDRQRRRDPERAGLVLSSWKATSRVDLITARLISKPDDKRERELREAIAEQLAAQLALQKYDRARLQERLEQLDQQIQRLERRGDATIESRFDAAMKKVQRVRRQNDSGEGVRPAAPSPRPIRSEEGDRP